MNGFKRNIFKVQLVDFPHVFSNIELCRLFRLPSEFVPNTDINHKYFGLEIRTGTFIRLRSSEDKHTSVTNTNILKELNWDENSVKNFRELAGSLQNDFFEGKNCQTRNFQTTDETSPFENYKHSCQTGERCKQIQTD